MRPKLTYANVTATLALIIAVGGASAFAATQLAKNSVGPKQLKKNAVTTAKIKNEAVTAAKVKKGTLTGTQINLASLGTVPSATTAANAQALDGQSADQLASASKLHCPSGMALYHGVCYQEAVQSANSWTFASITCWAEGLRLPTLGELLSFEFNHFTVLPPAEWTEPEWFTGTQDLAWVASAAKGGSSWGSAKTSESYPYRCVTLASN
jgi:hypothetical protein